MERKNPIYRSKIEFVNSNGFPPTICIQLLKWCNLKCAYCRAGSSPFEKERLSFAEVSELLIKLNTFGKWRISLTGGEPFYWPELTALLELIDELAFPFSVTTNAFASIEPLSLIPSRLWKNATLYVSIDGNRKTHDGIRGEGSFDKAIDFLRFARPVVPKLFVNTVLFTDPQLWAAELYELLNAANVNNWTIISPVKAGRWPQGAVQLADYRSGYNRINQIVNGFNGKTTTSFLDFAEAEGAYEDVVFINSDGKIRLPGFYQEESHSNNFPLVSEFSINDGDAALRIYESVYHFLSTQQFMR